MHGLLDMVVSITPQGVPEGTFEGTYKVRRAELEPMIGPIPVHAPVLE